MKKIIIMLCIVLFAFGLMACKEGQDENKITFTGTIIEINGDDAIVEPFEDESIRGSADKIVVNLSVSDEDFAIGDEIIVEYTGEVMESYPAMVNVLGVEKIE